MISLTTILAIASFCIDPFDRNFCIRHIFVPTGHFISKPFRHKKRKP
jgi:hypothetical protein